MFRSLETMKNRLWESSFFFFFFEKNVNAFFKENRIAQISGFLSIYFSKEIKLIRRAGEIEFKQKFFDKRTNKVFRNFGLLFRQMKFRIYKLEKKAS